MCLGVDKYIYKSLYFHKILYQIKKKRMKILLMHPNTFTLYLRAILHIHVCILILFTNPSARAGYDTRSIFKQSLTGLNSEFSFSQTSCLTKAEKPSLLYYLPIAGGRIIGFIPFPRVLVLYEMQSVSSRI